MGLDVTAYRKLTKLDAVFDADGEPIDPKTREPLGGNYVKVYANPDFPGREQPLEDRAVYAHEESEHVFSRSYGGYNSWRETLARMVGYPATLEESRGQTRMLHAAACWNGATGPFSELINFSDCEGVIGSVVAAKLAKDFAEWDERAKAVDALGFYGGYTGMRRGFDMAADDGAVKFS